MWRTLVPLLFLAGCGDSAETKKPPPTKPAEEKPATGTKGPAPAPTPTPEEMRDKAREEWDKHAHGLLKSFETRVFDPRRDALLDHVEGEIAVRIEGKDAKYRFVYDAANDAKDPLKFETVSEEAGVDAERKGRARQWAIVACCGPYAFVAYFVPPIPLRIAPPSDPKSKNIIVWAPPFKGPLNVSYSFDERQVVETRGEWTDDANKVATKFEWVFWRGRYLLSRSAIVNGTATAFEYDDRDGVNLLRRVKLSAGADLGEAVFTYANVRRRDR